MALHVEAECPLKDPVVLMTSGQIKFPRYFEVMTKEYNVVKLIYSGQVAKPVF